MTHGTFRYVVENEHGSLSLRVGLFSVLGDVHAHPLTANGCAQRNHQANQLEHRKCRNHAVEHRRDHSDGLDAELCGMSEQEAVRSAPARVGEYTCEQSTAHAADPVCSEHVQRIIESSARAPHDSEI